MSKLFYNSIRRKENEKELNEYVLILQPPTCELDTEVKSTILMYCFFQVFFFGFFLQLQAGVSVVRGGHSYLQQSSISGI